MAHMFSRFCALSGLLVAPFIATAAHAGPIVIEKNATQRVTLKAPAGAVVVANPEIADVTVVDSYTLYIVGRGFGTSSIAVTDRAGRPLLETQVVVTSASHGTVTVYKGKEPTIMVCNTTCVAQPGSETSAPLPMPSSQPMGQSMSVSTQPPM